MGLSRPSRMNRGFADKYQSARRWAYELFSPGLGGKMGIYTDWFIMILIAVNVSAVILETVDSLGAQYSIFFFWLEGVSVAIFTVEYIMRMWASIDDPDYTGILTGRLQFARKPLVVVDLLAILPFYLATAGIQLDLRYLRALRLVRLFRLLKLARYSTAMQSFVFVINQKKEKLLIAVFANGILLVLASSMMYYIEHPHQPEAFASIPHAFWWGVATLTTVGYGDIHPVTPLGQFVGAIVAVLGIGLFALPASILAAGFIEWADEETDAKEYCPHCGEKID